MKVLNIGNDNYTLEFSIEASLYGECTQKVTGLLVSLSEAGETANIKQVLASISDIPSTVLTMFYAGLMEHHGVSGDGTVTRIDDAKALIAEYFKENKGNEDATFYGFMNVLIECMGDDGFFDLIGLSKMFEQADEKVTKMPKTPQDHKRKTTKTTKTTEQ